jgi:HPt (histidine-containing phosphotransfer) domain-containing protein
MARMTAGANDEGLEAAIRDVWIKYRALNQERLQCLESVRHDVLAGALTSEARERGGLNAHRLAGATGSFGYKEISALCRDLELLLAGDAPLDAKVLAKKIDRIQELLRPALE